MFKYPSNDPRSLVPPGTVAARIRSLYAYTGDVSSQHITVGSLPSRLNLETVHFLSSALPLEKSMVKSEPLTPKQSILEKKRSIAEELREMIDRSIEANAEVSTKLPPEPIEAQASLDGAPPGPTPHSVTLEAEPRETATPEKPTRRATEVIEGTTQDLRRDNEEDRNSNMVERERAVDERVLRPYRSFPSDRLEVFVRERANPPPPSRNAPPKPAERRDGHSWRWWKLVLAEQDRLDETDDSESDCSAEVTESSPQPFRKLGVLRLQDAFGNGVLVDDEEIPVDTLDALNLLDYSLPTSASKQVTRRMTLPLRAANGLPKEAILPIIQNDGSSSRHQEDELRREAVPPRADSYSQVAPSLNGDNPVSASTPSEGARSGKFVVSIEDGPRKILKLEIFPGKATVHVNQK